jgi:hypothetical protein
MTTSPIRAIRPNARRSTRGDPRKPVLPPDPRECCRHMYFRNVFHHSLHIGFSTSITNKGDAYSPTRGGQAIGHDRCVLWFHINYVRTRFSAWAQLYIVHCQRSILGVFRCFASRIDSLQHQ